MFYGHEVALGLGNLSLRNQEGNQVQAFATWPRES